MSYSGVKFTEFVNTSLGDTLKINTILMFDLNLKGI